MVSKGGDAHETGTKNKGASLVTGSWRCGRGSSPPGGGQFAPSMTPQPDLPVGQLPYDRVDDGMNNYDVPPWAIKLVLQKEEI